MKLLNLSLSVFLLSLTASVFSQLNSVFVLIDETAPDIESLASEFSNQTNVYFADGSSLSAIDQISESTQEKKIDELHIYAATKQGAIVFSSLAITTINENEWSPYLKACAGLITKQVVIHSDVVFSGEEGSLLKQRLEDISGLVFATQY